MREHIGLSVLILGIGAGFILLGGGQVNVRGSETPAPSSSKPTPAQYLHNQYTVQPQNNASSEEVETSSRERSRALSPFQRKDEAPSRPEVSAESVLIMDLESRQTLYTQSPYEKRNIASITKLMTAMVVLDRYDYGSGAEVTMSKSAYQAYGGGYIQPQDTLTVEELMHALLLASSNDSAAALAEHFGGKQAFVKRMNDKAESVGLYKTQFTNPHGLDTPERTQYSTAYDVMKLGKHVFENYPVIPKILRVEETQLTTQTGESIQIGNINELVGELQTKGGKTGYTEDAGETFFTVADVHGRKVGFVVLGSDIGMRFQDTRKLIEWARQAYNI